MVVRGCGAEQRKAAPRHFRKSANLRSLGRGVTTPSVKPISIVTRPSYSTTNPTHEATKPPNNELRNYRTANQIRARLNINSSRNALNPFNSTQVAIPGDESISAITRMVFSGINSIQFITQAKNIRFGADSSFSSEFLEIV